MSKSLHSTIIFALLFTSQISLAKDCLIRIFTNSASDLSLPVHKISDYLIAKGYYVEIPTHDDGHYFQDFIRLGAFSQYIQRHYEENASDFTIATEELISNLWSGKSMAYITFKIGDGEEKTFETKTRITTMTDYRAEKNLISMVRRRVPVCD